MDGHRPTLTHKVKRVSCSLSFLFSTDDNNDDDDDKDDEDVCKRLNKRKKQMMINYD